MNTTDIKLLSLGKSKPQYPTRPGIRHFAGVVVVAGKKLPFTASTVPDDGSIKKNVGKHYFSFEGGEGDGEYLTCENCEHELSGPMASVVVPALEKLAKAKIASWRYTGGWWSFRVMAKKSAGETKHLGSRRVGPEVAVFKYGIPAMCPIHGKITHVETDVAD
jgi:hypothetical protein